VFADTDPANGNQADVLIRASLTDIRSQAGDDYNPDPAGPKLTLATKLRISDRFNGPSGSDPGTVQDLDYQDLDRSSERRQGGWYQPIGEDQPLGGFAVSPLSAADGVATPSLAAP
jgi:hypothetical protein